MKFEGQEGQVKSSLDEALQAVRAPGEGPALTQRIAGIERELVGKDCRAASAVLAGDGIDVQTLMAALAVKAAAGQINVVIHALGNLVSLPYLLEEGEVIEQLSLGAGNTGRSHDLETDRRVAEFKFITWRGADTIRQNSLFIDLFNLISSETSKRREMYVLGSEMPLRFLNGRRALYSVLSRNARARLRFDERHAGDGFMTVGEYWATVQDQVALIDLREKVPAFPADITLLSEVETDIS